MTLDPALVSLSPRTRDAYAFLSATADRGEKCPSAAAIAQHCGWNRTASARDALHALAGAGLIKVRPVSTLGRVITILATGRSTAAIAQPTDGLSARSREIRPQAIRMHDRGMSDNTIAKALRCTRRHIVKLLAEHDRRPAPVGRPPLDAGPPWPRKTMDHDRDWPRFTKFRDDPKAPQWGQRDGHRPPPRSIETSSFMGNAAAMCAL